MFFSVYTISIVFSVSFLIGVIELVRKGRLQEKYSLLWIFMSIILITLSGTPWLINNLATLLEIKNPPSMLFLFGMVYLLVYNLHITTVFSRQSEKITRLTQELAIMKYDLENSNQSTLLRESDVE